MCKLVRLSDKTELMVADLKRDFILNIIDSARLCEEIKKIVLFGSALEERCKASSDIDIAIVGDVSNSKFLVYLLYLPVFTYVSDHPHLYISHFSLIFSLAK